MRILTTAKTWAQPWGWSVALIALGFVAAGLVGCHLLRPAPAPVVLGEPMNDTITLPEPDRTGGLPLNAALEARRSVRDYTDEGLSLAQIGQLLWAAQGISDPRGLRTAPSAGALYPLETLVVVGQSPELDEGLYHYDVQAHALTLLEAGDLRSDLAAASLGQAAIAEAPLVVVFAAQFERTTVRYGQRGERYVYIEVGHAAQNLYLQAESLGLGTVAIGAFDADQVRRVLQLPEELEPLYILPVGHPLE